MKNVFTISATICVLGILVHLFLNFFGVKLPQEIGNVAAVSFFAALPVAIVSGAIVQIREQRAQCPAKQGRSIDQ